jgi:CBS domain-containing protein
VSTVRDLLAVKGPEVLQVTPETTIERVAQFMREERVGAFVVSRDGQHVDGLITERDLVLGMARHGAAVVRLRAGDLMHHSVETCAPDDSIRSAMRTMTRTRVRHLPVVEGGRMCGLVSIGDVIKSFVDDAELEARVLRDAYLARSSG